MKRNELNKAASVGMYYLYTMIVITLLLAIMSSCGTSKECHTKGYYVSKSIKKAQNGPKQ